MARKFELGKPLTADDLAYLQARYPENYVSRVVELAGGVVEDAENSPETASDSDSAPSATDSENGSENAGEGAEDLIGSTVTDFDPGQHTVDEVQAHLKDASDEERDRVLALERDGKGRSGILNG